ncbi:bacterioferritin [Oleiphilus sp. HI0009]|uniref:bacterioferritin n=2 Tax=Oleiphilus TaxID=141450 RepID=UPI0007C3F34B|nr:MULTISPECIES: bacterioferritin [unclassified Oleiphilus]KZX79037.1 bacterioferritin [Oleiphilus sp. HI0009]MCH2159361.1 bacterioferritin [Oleiphilaceae bacterium]KZY65728.1 bacterioferritin [Oleiphilus sp. HI0066]KZY66246.1 bacterioferritin [Oleiphilus sp. HI0066]KZY71981.1 bacterioferritin [Oleiphilus sp. HI0067]
MKGNQKVVDTLSKLLAGELTAVDQYFIHSRMYEDWGLNKLYERLDHEREEETDHADQMIRRILFLEGTPNLGVREPLNVGADVVSMLKSDLEVEYSVIQNLKDAIALCEQERDYETREMLLGQLKDSEEDHAYWLEKQLGLIDKIGLPNYLQSMM